jgi:DNA repair photolyase
MTKFIYAPAGKASEYAPLACNVYLGCPHGCTYCWAPLVLHRKREVFQQGAPTRPGFIAGLTADAKLCQDAGIREQVLLSFACDIYHPGDTSMTRRAIEILQQHGMAVCTLTKGGSRALRDLDLFRPDRDCFASTLTFLSDDLSRHWEPAAALPADRVATLRRFHDRGIFTWVSLEPVLDIEASLQIIRETHGFVDHYKFGRANYLGDYTKNTDWRSYTQRMIELCQQLKVSHYVKRDLEPFLPAGYHNPMHVQCRPSRVRR